MFNQPERRGWAAGWERSRAREIRLKSERGKCSHSQGLWAPYAVANYLFNEVISFRKAERQFVWLEIKCPYFTLSWKMPFLLLVLNNRSPTGSRCQVNPVLQSVVVHCQIMITAVLHQGQGCFDFRLHSTECWWRHYKWFWGYMATLYSIIKAPFWILRSLCPEILMSECNIIHPEL